MTHAFLVMVALLGFASSIEINLCTPEVINRRLEQGRVPAAQRQATVKALFQEVSCNAEEQSVNKHASNVICTLPGTTDSVIVIGGHFDFADRGDGIIDDWSGVALLPSLYQALQNKSRVHTYVFVAFAEEEKGLNGSERYVKLLTKEARAKVHAFVNLECLGMNQPMVWLSRASPVLATHWWNVAASIGVTPRGMNVEKIGDDDSHPFLSAHMPVITLHSVTSETLPLLHSEKDTLAAIHADDYYTAYRLAAFYLAYLDEQLK